NIYRLPELMIPPLPRIFPILTIHYLWNKRFNLPSKLCKKSRTFGSYYPTGRKNLRCTRNIHLTSYFPGMLMAGKSESHFLAVLLLLIKDFFLHTQQDCINRTKQT